MRPLPRLVLLAAALTTAVALLPAAVSAEGSAPPGDYIAMADELSQPIYGPDDIVTVTHHLELHDGETKHLQITMPDPERFEGPDGQGFPVPAGSRRSSPRRASRRCMTTSSTTV
jgi:hypothetical protein